MVKSFACTLPLFPKWVCLHIGLSLKDTCNKRPPASVVGFKVRTNTCLLVTVHHSSLCYWFQGHFHTRRCIIPAHVSYIRVSVSVKAFTCSQMTPACVIVVFQGLVYVEVGLNTNGGGGGGLLRAPAPVAERVEYASLDLTAMTNNPPPPPPPPSEAATTSDLGIHN